MLFCEVCKTFKNTYFEEYLRNITNGCFWRCSIKKLFLKTCNINRTKEASDKCSVKKLFLVIDRAVKVTCFYIDQHCKKSVAALMSCSFLKNNLRHDFFGPEFFLVKNNSQGTENTKLPLLRNVNCSI